MSLGVLLDPHVARYLIEDQGEKIIDEVHKHPMAVVGPIFELLACVPILLIAFFVPSQWAWVPIVIALLIALHAGWRILEAQYDRFVITNMRVFRVHGILTQHLATMPLSRILDISVEKPLIGRIFNYGHFVFESAAQAQGLREIRYVGWPDERDLTIQRTLARAGLRGSGSSGAKSRA
ncbi:PH domain-containing protein [Agromyces seonyuensis]|uniref:PH domain-containing protein n=1 Tax=Agromyces seonyuensis TaxID=2662446 RepID=A0A6I4P080_9MICO|nr:PH domain-containing protein [Agromyces seonyuensis]MWC00034.1 PH domain-containing protein [Agromyces seonyuensis]